MGRKSARKETTNAREKPALIVSVSRVEADPKRRAEFVKVLARLALANLHARQARGDEDDTSGAPEREPRA